MKKKKITNPKISELLKLIKKVKKIGLTGYFPWKWEDMEFITDDPNEGTYITVPETSYLGDTGICLNNDSYEGHGEDCYLVQEAIEWLEPLLNEIKDLRKENDKLTQMLLNPNSYKVIKFKA